MNHDHDAELAVLAACLQSAIARREAKNTLAGADFHEPMHELVWDQMLRLDRHGKDVDLVTVQSMVNHIAGAADVMLTLVTAYARPESVGHYAAIVRSWAIKRRIADAATQVQQRALSPDLNAVGFAASVANQFTAIRDAGQTDDDVTVKTLDEFRHLPDRPEDWVIEGLIERGDRLILTGGEGLGKSTLLRQIAVMAAAGLHPFQGQRRVEPIRALIYDSENSERQVKRKAWRLHNYARDYGQRDPGPFVFIDCPGRIDITRDRDLARLHRLCDMFDPHLVVVGPMYRLCPRALQTDDEASPVLAALDTVKDRDIALLIEAHAGHAIGRDGREWRPRGSSALMGWPEFGYGLKNIDGGFADLVAWRGARDEREWPRRLERDPESMTWTQLADDHPAMRYDPQEAS